MKILCSIFFMPLWSVQARFSSWWCNRGFCGCQSIGLRYRFWHSWGVQSSCRRVHHWPPSAPTSPLPTPRKGKEWSFDLHPFSSIPDLSRSWRINAGGHGVGASDATAGPDGVATCSCLRVQCRSQSPGYFTLTLPTAIIKETEWWIQYSSYCFRFIVRHLH